MKQTSKELRDFYILWSTQGLSQLGSAVTAFALTIWLYEQTGSALDTALLRICTYVPYVLLSVFAGVLADRFDKKRTMLVCDTFAAVGSVIVFIMIRTELLMPWHLYLINALNGLMNTVQQPASEVAMTLVIPKRYYQKTSGLMSFTYSATNILSPLIATALYALAGMTLVIALDLFTFATAFFALLLFIRLPDTEPSMSEGAIAQAKEGFAFLRKNDLLLTLILFMAGVNLVASAFDAVLPALVIPNPRGGSSVLGIVSSFSGASMVAGSLAASVLPKPKDRVRVIYLTMLFSLGSENFILALSRSPVLWCIAQVIGWSVVPIMNANLNVVMRSEIPVELQGRIYACRNTLQFFTIPIGLFFGGLLVDEVCEPFMSLLGGGGLMNVLFGEGKGSGAALAMFILGVVGIVMCLAAGRKMSKYHYSE